MVEAQIEQILRLQVATEGLRAVVEKRLLPDPVRNSVSLLFGGKEPLLDPIPFAERLPTLQDLVPCHSHLWFWAGRETETLGWRWTPDTNPICARSEGFTHWLPGYVRYLPAMAEPSPRLDLGISESTKDLFNTFATVCGYARNYVEERGDAEGAKELESMIAKIRYQLFSCKQDVVDG